MRDGAASRFPDASVDPIVTSRGWLAHSAVASLGGLLTFLFWRSRMEWDPDMRLWRAVGDTAFVLPAMALAIGPAAVLWRRAARLLAWRRAVGIWSALAAAIHAYLVWDRWALWSLDRLVGFEDLSPVEGPPRVLTDPGFGLANMVGLVALLWLLILAATSFDGAVRGLGARAWRHVQAYANVAFQLVALHSAYFLFLHYQLSLKSLVFQKAVPPPIGSAGGSPSPSSASWCSTLRRSCGRSGAAEDARARRLRHWDRSSEPLRIETAPGPCLSASAS